MFYKRILPKTLYFNAKGMDNKMKNKLMEYKDFKNSLHPTPL